MATLAADGLIARESGEWAGDKLFYVARYMDIFTGSMKNKWAHRAYIDLMSGPGLCVVPSTGREFDGSPLLALKTKTPFTDVLLVEADPINFYAQQLKSLNYHTSVLPLTMKNTKGGTLYRPIFASRHSRGIEFWTEISSKRDPSGQQRLI